MKQSHLGVSDRVNLGSYYTPDTCVHLVRGLLAPLIDKGAYLLDNACGYGSLLNGMGGRRSIGVDIDRQAVEKARILCPLARFHQMNALQGITRKNLAIPQNAALAIVGNPPYNDRTSQTRRRIKNASVGIDPELRKRDLGMSFLLSYIRFEPDVVCVLHPLSYLIKRANFRMLDGFFESYRLMDGVVIDSRLFEENSRTTSFPILVALYRRNRCGMAYHEIESFRFRTMDGGSLVLSEHDFITRDIDKYPGRSRVPIERDSLFFWQMRDINALKRNRTFVEEWSRNAIVIDKRKLDYYVYIDVFKRHIHRLPYYYGNCDVFIDRTLFKKHKPAFISDSVLHHPWLRSHLQPAKRCRNASVGKYFDQLLQKS